MPSRRDLFRVVSKVATNAGVKTVWRGPFVPKDHGDIQEDAYPVAGYIDSPNGEDGGTQENGYVYEGEVELWLWVSKGDLSGILGPQPGLVALDDLHDGILDQLSDSYPKIHSQTISLWPSDGKWWFPAWWYQDTAHNGALASIHYKFSYSPKPH